MKHTYVENVKLECDRAVDEVLDCYPKTPHPSVRLPSLSPLFLTQRDDTGTGSAQFAQQRYIRLSRKDNRLVTSFFYSQGTARRREHKLLLVQTSYIHPLTFRFPTFHLQMI